MHQASWVHNRRRIDSRHPDADLVLLEEIGDKVVEVHIRLSVVEVGQLVVITTIVSYIKPSWALHYLRLILSIKDLHR